MSALPLFGRLALREGLISIGQLEVAIRVQGRGGGRRRLGDILVELGYLEPTQLAHLLGKQRESTRALEPAPPPLEGTLAPSLPQLPPDTSWIERLDVCATHRVNDLLLSHGHAARMRAHGRISAGQGRPMTAAELRSLADALLDDEHRATLAHIGCVGTMLPLPSGGRARALFQRCEGSLAAAFRLLPARRATLSTLGLPAVLARLATFDRGLVLVSGPVASGRTSTAAALLDLVNEERSELVMSAERLVEHPLASKRSVVQQRARAVSEPLEQALGPARHRPSVLLVDPLRGQEDLRAALRLAETGHLVYAVVQGMDVRSTLSWLVDTTHPDEREWLCAELGRALRAVVCQRLVPRIGGSLVPAVEQMLVGKYTAELLTHGRFRELPSVIQAGESQGMLDMQRSLSSLRARGLTT